MSSISSEIHSECDECRQHQLQQTTFTIVKDEGHTSESITPDADGDLEVPRKRRKSQQSITIKHQTRTNLEDVGLQVWGGCLLLIDFIISHPHIFRDAYVLELGSGTGLAGICAAQFSKRVFITDAFDDVLSNCAENVALNASDGGWLAGLAANAVRVRKFDICDPQHTQLLSSHSSSHDNDVSHNEKGGTQREGSRFEWSNEDVDDLRHRVRVFLAADIIYDDDLTTAFVDLIPLLLSDERAILFVAIERRTNFSLSELSVVHSDSHFLNLVRDLYSENGSSTLTVEVENIPAHSIPKHLLDSYRSPDLFLYKLTRRSNSV